MNRLLVVCAAFVAGAAIGGAASWLILDQGERPGTRPESPAVTGAAFVPPAAQVAPLVAGSRPSVAAIRPRSVPDSGLMPDVDLTAINAGTGTISGKVKADKGEPLAGVVMRAEYSGDRHERSREWKLGDGTPPDSDSPEALQGYLEDVALRRSMRREAVTDEKGEFTLAGLLDDRYSLHAYLKGWSFDPDQPDLRWSARPGVIADFTGKRVVILPIDVRLSDGTQPKRAQINITVHNDSRAERWAPERSELRLGAGSYSMSATAGDHEEWRSEAQNVVLKEGATPSQITFRLNARTGIHGRVVVPKGYAVDSLSIFAVRYAGTAVPEESALRNGQNAWASAWNGYEFNFFDLAAGNWLIGAGTWESVFSSKSVEVAAGAITETTLEITDAGATGLVVKVVAPDGASVADAQVRAFAAGAQWDSPEGFSVRPKKDGAGRSCPRRTRPPTSRIGSCRPTRSATGKRPSRCRPRRPASSRSTCWSPLRST